MAHPVRPQAAAPLDSRAEESDQEDENVHGYVIHQSTSCGRAPQQRGGETVGQRKQVLVRSGESSTFPRGRPFLMVGQEDALPLSQPH